MRPWTVRIVLTLLGLLAFGSWGALPVQAQLPKGAVEVGRTRDACARQNAVRFRGKSGDVSVAASTSKAVEMPAMQRELTWYCGDSRERCANGQPFNWVVCERAGNGAIQWIFYRVN
jgi:hypothetical protein